MDKEKQQKEIEDKALARINKRRENAGLLTMTIAEHTAARKTTDIRDEYRAAMIDDVMKIEITIPDEYRRMVEVIVADTKKQNPDWDDVAIDKILSQKCREFVLGLHDQIMMNLPTPEK